MTLGAYLKLMIEGLVKAAIRGNVFAQQLVFERLEGRLPLPIESEMPLPDHGRREPQSAAVPGGRSEQAARRQDARRVRFESKRLTCRLDDYVSRSLEPYENKGAANRFSWTDVRCFKGENEWRWICQ